MRVIFEKNADSFYVKLHEDGNINHQITVGIGTFPEEAVRNGIKELEKAMFQLETIRDQGRVK